MKILNITDNSKTFLCTLTYDEIKLITGGKMHGDDLARAMRTETNLDLSKFNTLNATYDIRSVDSAINSLKSAITFLDNKKESLKYINSLKEIKGE